MMRATSEAALKQELYLAEHHDALLRKIHITVLALEQRFCMLENEIWDSVAFESLPARIRTSRLSTRCLPKQVREGEGSSKGVGEVDRKIDHSKAAGFNAPSVHEVPTPGITSPHIVPLSRSSGATTPEVVDRGLAAVAEPVAAPEVDAVASAPACSLEKKRSNFVLKGTSTLPAAKQVTPSDSLAQTGKVNTLHQLAQTGKVNLSHKLERALSPLERNTSADKRNSRQLWADRLSMRPSDNHI